VIGGGWIGLEVAATARRKGAEVTVLEAAPRLCERTVPPEISEHLLALHQRNGTQIILRYGLTGIARGDGDTVRLEPMEGKPLEVDTLVIGIGLVANDELARAAGLECRQGVIVDRQCRTSDP